MSTTLKKIDAEIMAQAISNDEISKNLDEGVKNNLGKFGVAALLSTAAFFSSGIFNNVSAMDNSLKGTIGAGVMAGVITNGARYDIPPECNVEGINGWKVGGAAVAGSAVANKFMGKGNGKTAMTIIGGLFGATAATSYEVKRMQAECAKYGVNIPNNPQNSVMPTDTILYSGTNFSTGRPYMVTIGNSIGIAALVGKINPPTPIEQANPLIDKALNETAQNLERAYMQFDGLAQQLSSQVRGTDAQRYDVNQHSQYQANQNRQQLQYMQQNFQQAHENFATTRAMFIHMADTAVEDGVNIQKYSQVLNYIDEPHMAKVLYNGTLPNKYVNLPNARRR